MENNQNSQPAVEKNKNKQPAEGGAQGGRNNHHRHRRHHRPKNDGEKKVPQSTSMDKNFFSPEGEQKNDSTSPSSVASEDKQSRHQQHKKNHKNRGGEGKGDQKQDRKPEQAGKGGKNQPQGEKNSSQNNKNNRKKGNHQGKGNQRRGLEQRPYDPYEEVRPEELSLEELRARIVLKPSDIAPIADKQADVCEPSDETPPDQATVDAILRGESSVTPAEAEERVEVVGVRFRSAGKTYYFDPHGIKAQQGEFAIVETARGAEFGEVSLANTMVNVKDTVSPLRPILRIATPEDIRHDAENREKEKKALITCQERIAAHKLEMKLIDVQYAFDNSKLLFYFTADGRVDFRDLVKDLASTFRTRIELRQIGIRDEAKMLGGLGACGRPLCCSTFLSDFVQVSIRMAKEQNLSLNSGKISGCCGRLMCCLQYEYSTYASESAKTPPVDSLVKTANASSKKLKNERKSARGLRL